MSSLAAEPSTDQLQQLAYLEDWAAARGMNVDELVADEAEYAKAAANWRKAHDGKEPMSRELASSMSGSDDQAIKDLIDYLNATVPDADLSEMEATQAEPEGERTRGRPDLANPAASPAARRGVDAVDEARKEQMERQSHSEWEEQARVMIERDRAGVKRRLLEIASNPSSEGLSDAVDVKAAQMLVAEIMEEAVHTNNADQLREAQILTYAYRESGTETARAMAARRDPHKTPEARHKEFLASIIFRPTRKVSKQIKKAPTPAQKSREIDRLKAQLKKAESSGNASKAQVIKLRRELVDMRNAPDKVELLTQDGSERLKRIEDALNGMGVTLDDIFSGETELRLKGAKIVTNYAGNLDAKRKRVVEMLNAGISIDEIRKASSMSMGQINDVIDDFRREFIAKHKEKFRRGMTADQVQVDKLLSAGDADSMVDDATAIAEMEKALEALGFGKGAKNASVRAAKRAKRRGGKRKAKKSQKPRAKSVEGLEYEWEIDNPRPGDRSYQRPAQGELGDADSPPIFDISDPVEVARVARVIEAQEGSGFDMVYEYWINAILSGPQTHVANITGNTLNAGLDMTLQRGVEASVNAMLSTVGLGDPDAPQFGEFKHMVRGIVPGIKDGLKAGIQAWGSETSLFTNRVLDSQIELGGMGRLEDNYKLAIKGKKGHIIRIPGRGLLFMDEFFKGMLARMQVGAEAYRMAKAEGLTGTAMEQYIAGQVNRVGSDAWHKAAERAIDLVFQSDFDQDRIAGKMMQGITQLRNNFPGARYIIPFLRTIANIFAIGIRKSPVGTANMLYRVAGHGLWKVRGDGLVARKYGRPEFIRNFSEQLIAWTATAMLYAAAEGDEDDDEKWLLITGSRPFNTTPYGVNQLYNRTGLSAYTIRIGGPGGFVFQYGRYEPISTALGVTMDSLKIAKQGNELGAGEVMGQVAGNIASNLTDKTFARGIGDIMEVASDPGRNLSRWASRFTTSFVPNILKQPVRVMDPMVRESSTTSRGSEIIPNMIERTVESALPIGGMKEPEIDVWGREVEKEGTMLTRLAVPQRAGMVQQPNRVDRMLLAWNRQNPADTYAPPTPRRYFIEGGERVDMSDKEFTEYQKIRGQSALKLLNQVPMNIGNPTEKDLERVRKALSAGHDRAKRAILLKRRVAPAS